MGTSAVRDDAVDPSPGVDIDDPREMIEFGVLMANGRLAGRSFADRAEATAWASPEDGDTVVAFNAVCQCDFTS